MMGWLFTVMVCAYGAAWQAGLVSPAWLILVMLGWVIGGRFRVKGVKPNPRAVVWVTAGLTAVLAVDLAINGFLEAFLHFVGLLQGLLLFAEAAPQTKILALSLTVFAAATAGIDQLVWVFFFAVLIVSAVTVLRQSAASSLSWRPAWRWSLAVGGITVVVFALLPRPGPLARGLAAARRPPFPGGLSAFSGFADTMRLGRYGEIKLDHREYARVEAPSIPGPMPGGLRLRGLVFDQFDGRQWHRQSLARRVEEWQRQPPPSPGFIHRARRLGCGGRGADRRPCGSASPRGHG